MSNPKFIPGTKAVLASDLRFRGTPVFTDGGEINAGNRKDVLKMLATAANALASGQELVTAEEAAVKEKHAQDQAHRRNVLAAITAGTKEAVEGAVTVGAEIAGNINESVNRVGFTRALCQFQDLVQGQRPEISIQDKDVIAAVLSGPVQARLQIVRDNVLMPPEVSITARLIIEARKVNQSRRDLLAEKYAEGVEHVLVNEDRMWKTGADLLVEANDQQASHTGDLTASVFGEGIKMITGHNLPPSSLLISSNLFADFVTSKEFENLIEGSTRIEIIRTGMIGTLYGMTILTDGTREPRQKVLGAGEIYFVSSPEFVGEYSDRGGVTAQPLTAADTGINGVGWHINEEFSLGLVNHRSIAKYTVS